tara:strand:+ start:608 stop:823 length:216 start_codon:yes stop_codon:yes gene_type:complete
MTTKEKAIQLVNIYSVKACECNEDTEWDYDKECALICVDEKIETLLPYAGLLDIKKQVQELEEVKQEIKKL